MVTEITYLTLLGSATAHPQRPVQSSSVVLPFFFSRWTEMSALVAITFKYLMVRNVVIKKTYKNSRLNL